MRVDSTAALSGLWAKNWAGLMAGKRAEYWAALKV
jgi:hypothetical protein